MVSGIINLYWDLFLAIWLGYKWKHKTKLIAYQDMDVQPMLTDRD